MNTPGLCRGLVAACALAVAGTLCANPYLSGSFGTTSSATPLYRSGTSLSIDSGPSGNIAIGYRMPGYRFEFEVGTSTSDISSLVNATVITPAAGSFERLTAMVNLYYDFDSIRGLSPFVGVGAGYARTGIKSFNATGIPSVDDEAYSFAWQFMGGLAYEISDSLTFFAQYRQVRLRRVELSDAFNATFELTGTTFRTVEAGVRFNFY